MSDSTQVVGPPTPQTPSASTDASTARIVLSAEAFVLARLFERVSDARVTLEPAVANPVDHALLVVQASEHDRSTVENALRTDPAVAALEVFDTHNEGWRYRVTWEGHARRLVQKLVAEGVTILSARGQLGRWKLRLLAPEREAIGRTYEMLENLGGEPDCRSITTFEGERSGYGEMSDEQHEALVTAFEMGYYDIPRTITSAELADHLGISHQALSERFRRAYKQLLEARVIAE